MKTVFINPDAKIYKNIPPLALAYASTILNIPVIDQNTRTLPKDRFLNKKADSVGLFIRSITIKESKRIRELYLKRFPKTEIKSIYTPIDVQCCYPTIQIDKQIKITQPFGDSYPFPDFSLFDSYEIFLNHWHDGRWPYGILTSVGCPFHCIYCAAANRGWKARSPKNCVEELKMAKNKYGIVSFEILDDAFNVDRDHVLEFCRLVRPLKLQWSCANGLRADLFDEEIAMSMAKSGCENISFGVESVSSQVLKTIKKGESIEQISRAVDIAKKYIKNVNGFFIIGLPGSSYESDLNSVGWMVKKGITGVFSYYVPKVKEFKRQDIFFGDGARPQSDVYPKSRQQSIYYMTSFMNDSGGSLGIINRSISAIKLYLKFDRKNFFSHVFNNIKRLTIK